MGDFRSKSYVDGHMQLELYGRGPPAPPPPSGLYDYQSYKGKDLGAVSPTSRKSGKWFNDPEFQRKRRVASYKAYSVEGKVKGSIRKSFRWLKDKYTKVIYGWW